MRRRAVLALGTAATLAGAAFWWWRPSRWRYIVVHHSGGSSGDLELLQRVHRERQPNDPLDMIPYHFVIGNGQGMELGQVTATRRWEQGIWGAHVRGVVRNARGIGICLIGDFEKAEVPDRQFDALVTLTRQLMSDHDIYPEGVSLHGETPGEQTLCPGQKFPRTAFRAAITSVT